MHVEVVLSVHLKSLFLRILVISQIFTAIVNKIGSQGMQNLPPSAALLLLNHERSHTNCGALAANTGLQHLS
jgi:hypothetical protein